MKKMRNGKKIISGLMAALLVAFAAACGAQGNKGVDETAAVRGAGVGVGETYIDDDAIALAGATNDSKDITAALTAAYNLVNTQRANAGLSALTWNEGLAQAAKVRSQEIVSTFSHTRPDGSDWWTVNSNLQYGENLARLYQTSDAVVTAWMNSPTHRANILDGNFKTMGIAIYQTSDGGWYWAQEFGY